MKKMMGFEEVVYLDFNVNKKTNKKKMGIEQVVDLVCNRIKRNMKKNYGFKGSCVFGF